MAGKPTVSRPVLPCHRHAQMHRRFVEREGRGVGLRAQLAPVFLTFSDRLGL